MNTSVDRMLWHFNTLPITPRIEFTSQNLNRVVAAFNASDLAILIESQPLDLDLDVVDTLVYQNSTSIEVVLKFQRPILFVC